jgi:hypothetical protein
MLRDPAIIDLVRERVCVPNIAAHLEISARIRADCNIAVDCNDRLVRRAEAFKT